ncbi:hypothetical protein NL449_28665, partial [Klebsiella pneumoniae]|nr:hypothetical protein [Klebsiella pneumoniae]
KSGVILQNGLEDLLFVQKSGGASTECLGGPSVETKRVRNFFELRGIFLKFFDALFKNLSRRGQAIGQA